MSEGKMAESIRAAEVFPPGEYIKDELEARGWAQADLAEIIGTSAKLVSDLIAARCSVTPETAQALGSAFGTSSQVWMNLDNAYRLWRLKPDNDISRRANLYAKGPIRQMLRRHWIEPSDNLDVLEQRVKDFYLLASINDVPAFPYAARRSTLATTPSQLAWLFRAKALADGVSVARTFSDSSCRDAIAHLRPMMANPEDARMIPQLLAEQGIRLVCVEGLSGAKIDGATFWPSKDSPVIALSFRYDRIDWFWFTLLHELDHVANRERSLDIDLVGTHAEPGEVKSKAEQRADRNATEALVPRGKLDSFITRVEPLFAKVRIMGFANTIGVNPGIVVGQLQRRDVISYAHSRDLLARVRVFVLGAALTDGWGYRPTGL